MYADGDLEGPVPFRRVLFLGLDGVFGTGDNKAWLRLTPIARRFVALVGRVEVDGGGRQARRMTRVILVDDDRVKQFKLLGIIFLVLWKRDRLLYFYRKT